MSHSFSPHSCRISKSVPPTRAGSLLDSLYQVISQPMLAVQKNCKRSKSLFDIPLQSSLWGLFCGTPLDAMFWLPCVANLPGFSYMPICATSYLSINLGSNHALINLDCAMRALLALPCPPLPGTYGFAAHVRVRPGQSPVLKLR